MPRAWRRRLATLAGAGALALLLAGPAAAQDLDLDIDLDRGDAIVVLTGRVDVREGETTGDVVIFNGPVRVDGTVDGSLVVFNGRVDITGTVAEDVVNLNGRVTVAEGARIGGDLATRLPPTVDPGATVEGTQRRIDPNVAIQPFAAVARFGFWLAVSISTLALGLLLLLFAPRAGAAVAGVGATGVGPAIGWGLALFFGLPIAGVIALLTIVGIPFGIGLLLALGAIYAIGYVAGAHLLGRLLVKPPASAFLAFLVGWGILRLVALVPVAGGLTWFAATTYGLGMLALVAWRAKGTGAEPAPLEAIAPPPPPSEPG